jgi:transcription elongation GreA/GreB family factor
MLREELLLECKKILQDRIDRIKRIMDEAQASSNEESKSSAGDKYETGRAMMQLEKDKAASQLSETLNLRKALDQINLNKPTSIIQLGSIVQTDYGHFFLAAALGNIDFKGIKYFAISPVSPVGKELLNKKAGERVIVNDRSFQIMKVY